MSYSIPNFTKILTLATASFFLILLGALSVNLLWCQECTFYHFTLFPGRRGKFFFLRAQIYTCSSTMIKKF